jgi:hypothetical protein
MMDLRICLLPSLACLLSAGCLGPADEGSTAILIAPGIYSGEYRHIPDSLRQNFEAELILDADGSYRNIWLQDSEAVYDEQGAWSQLGENMYLRNSTEDWAEYRSFSQPERIDDDTSRIREATDTSFVRNEWVPIVLRKRQWTRYTRQAAPATLSDGVYTHSRTFQGVPYLDRIVLDEGKYLYSEIDSVEREQGEARFSQVGSFLALEANRTRYPDSTGTQWDAWQNAAGYRLKRLRAVSDTAFEIWNPIAEDFSGGWDHYSKLPQEALPREALPQEALPPETVPRETPAGPG